MNSNAPPEMWGGVECSVVRIGGETRNQLLETGHFDRSDDLELIAGLGIKKLRYPALWDTVRYGCGREDWRWPDLRLRRLRELGIEPIVGLLHHGPGPRTHLLDPAFTQLLAGYAQAVAQRYPWIEAFTPINEPLTTARISGLYGLWHPHGRDEVTCFRLLVAQCRAIAKAMTAIRKVNPKARLVQTEDFGRTFSTPQLRYQADYENERRWLAIDLLTGRVDRKHMFHERLIVAGIAESDLAELNAEPCHPDIVGIDYYLTSDRFLDHRIDLHPGEPVGGNGIDTYVDIAAVRSERCDEASLASRIREVWQRYRLPLAVTELHNGCTRDEQLRWLIDGWEAARTARRNGTDVRAVTAWALLGMVDWNSMLLQHRRHYESGAFDIRCDPLRPTALARAIASLANGKTFDHPAIDRPGWWRHERSAPPWARPILLSGTGEFRPVLEECCIARRLSFTPVTAHIDAGPLLSADAWASIHAGGQNATHTPLRLSCRFADGGQLSVEAAYAFDRRSVADAFLDLVIDGWRGAARLTRAEPGNQYEVTMIERRNGENLAPPERGDGARAKQAAAPSRS